MAKKEELEEVEENQVAQLLSEILEELKRLTKLLLAKAVEKDKEESTVEQSEEDFWDLEGLDE